MPRLCRHVFHVNNSAEVGPILLAYTEAVRSKRPTELLNRLKAAFVILGRVGVFKSSNAKSEDKLVQQQLWLDEKVLQNADTDARKLRQIASYFRDNELPPVAADPAPPAAKMETSEVTGWAGSTPEQPAIPSAATRETVLRELEPAARKAYFTFQYAETMNGRKLEDREAYDSLRENGIDQGKGDLGELTDYELPDSLETFQRYLSKARKPLGENKYTRRAGRAAGSSIVKGDEIEYQRGDDD